VPPPDVSAPHLSVPDFPAPTAPLDAAAGTSLREAMRALRDAEYARLDAQGHAYLDHTGSALYPESLPVRHLELLRAGVFGNPHSRNPTARAATALVDAARRRVLAFFNADPAEWEAVFTLNATAALKLVGEAYPFAPGGTFRLVADNHNSVNGIREYAASHGADVRYLHLDGSLRVPDVAAQLAGADRSAANLFAFPAQSNFSGVRHPLAWVELAHELGYDVLIDAAAFVPTSRLDLSRVKPDYVTVSFYKMAGYPTGVGALLARRDALGKLTRPWFGGGTVRFVSAQNQVRIMYRDASAFEDGTLDFLGLAAVPLALDFLDRVGMERVGAHVSALTAHLLAELQALRHANGAPMVCLYGPRDVQDRGGTVAFNVLDADGHVIDCRRVEQAAAEAGVSIRTGYFCNPGAAETSFELPADEARRCYDTLAGDAFTLAQFSACLSDRPTGAVRASLGLSSHEGDVARFVEVLRGFAGPRA
jgi:selenocysteine lyase/cysteine desulfurase